VRRKKTPVACEAPSPTLRFGWLFEIVRARFFAPLENAGLQDDATLAEGITCSADLVLDSRTDKVS
jgi:hypothetical protein